MKLKEYIEQLQKYNNSMSLDNGVEPDVKFEYHSILYLLVQIHLI